MMYVRKELIPDALIELTENHNVQFKDDDRYNGSIVVRDTCKDLAFLDRHLTGCIKVLGVYFSGVLLRNSLVKSRGQLEDGIDICIYTSTKSFKTGNINANDISKVYNALHEFKTMAFNITYNDIFSGELPTTKTIDVEETFPKCPQINRYKEENKVLSEQCSELIIKQSEMFDKSYFKDNLSSYILIETTTGSTPFVITALKDLGAEVLMYKAKPDFGPLGNWVIVRIDNDMIFNMFLEGKISIKGIEHIYIKTNYKGGK